MSDCGKRRFRDKLSAKMALVDIGRKDRIQARERRAYKCPLCFGWHLTSQQRSAKDAPRRPQGDGGGAG